MSQAAAARVFAVGAIAFDLDGTLLDTIHDLAGAVNALLDELGHPPLPKSDVRDMIGKGITNLIVKALTAATGQAPTAELAAHALAIYHDCYFELLGSTAREIHL